MNKQEFLMEIKENKLYTEEFAEIYEKFCGYQSIVIDVLNEFHRVCEKNHITYQLAYGSLLGAIRNEGQIPWDYDIDVFVPYEEKDSLIKALKQDLNKKYYFYCPDNEKKCRHEIMRLAPKEYRSEVLHVDVFYLTGCPENKDEREKYCETIKKLSHARFIKLVNINDEASFFTAVKRVFRKMQFLFKNVEAMQKEYESICSKYPAKTSSVCVSADVFATWYEFPQNIWQTELLELPMGIFRIPTCYKEILNIVYGDYMKIPPLEDRLEEIKRNYNLISNYGLR